VHLIRVNLQQGDPIAGTPPKGDPPTAVSSQQGLALLHLALAEVAAGVPVGLNGILVPGEDSDRVPLGGDTPCPPGSCPFPAPSTLPFPVEFIIGLPIGALFPFDPATPPTRRGGQSLWVGTYNAQAFPPIPGTFSGCCEDREGRIAQIAERIRQSDYDIFAFNEIFSNEVQWALAGLLGSVSYPHFVQHIKGEGFRTNLDPINPFLDVRFRNFCRVPVLRLVGIRSCQDSGLMLFSRFRFLPLPDPIPSLPVSLRAVSA